MSKPLELTVYPPIPECPQPSGWSFARDDWFDDRTAERKLSGRKRLTDAELAADYWSAVVDYEDSCKPSGEDMDHEAICNQVQTLERFATARSYDE